MGRRGWLRWGLVAVFVVALVWVSRRDHPDAAIQGAWTYSEPSVGGVIRQSSVHLNWKFENGKLTADSCCELRPGLSARYRVVKAEGEQLILILYEIAGDDTEPYELHIGIDRATDTLTIEGIGPFVRSRP